MDSELSRLFTETPKKTLPFVRDVIDKGAEGLLYEDIIVFTNSDTAVSTDCAKKSFRHLISPSKSNLSSFTCLEMRDGIRSTLRLDTQCFPNAAPILLAVRKNLRSTRIGGTGSKRI